MWRVEISKDPNFVTVGQLSKNVGTRIEIILHTVLKFRVITLVSTEDKLV